MKIITKLISLYGNLKSNMRNYCYTHRKRGNILRNNDPWNFNK